MKARIVETENQPDIMKMEPRPRLKLNSTFTEDFRIRRKVYLKIENALNLLPPSYGFVVYEAYRSLERQKYLWETAWNKITSANPDWCEERIKISVEKWVANPYGDGSGHQTGAAIDATLFEVHDGNEIDMGTCVQEFNKLTSTKAPGLNKKQREHRLLLCRALEGAGLINYPEEWWHFSFGERLWASLSGAEQTLFAGLPPGI